MNRKIRIFSNDQIRVGKVTSYRTFGSQICCREAVIAIQFFNLKGEVAGEITGHDET